MKKLLNSLGLYTKKQYDSVKKVVEDIDEQLEECEKSDTIIKARLDRCQSNLKKLPYEFEKLLEIYNEDQLNALAYEMINHIRNNREKRHLLERWDNRIKTARESLKDRDLKHDKVSPSMFPGNH